MTKACVPDALRESVEEVLEKMFFAESGDPGPIARTPEELVAAQVDFEGSPSGCLRLRIGLQAARQMAGDFLGVEPSELADGAAVEVVGELANMICGSVLSRMESETIFRLAKPLAVSENGVVDDWNETTSYTVALPGGLLSVRFECGDGGA
jgi:CheY-specific phosphatase CheX